MKKSLFTLALTFIAVIGFGTQSFAQTINLSNDLIEDVDISVCGTVKVLVAGEVYSTGTTCTAAPCSFQITLPCGPPITVTVPCTGIGPYSSTQTFPPTTTPPCAGFSVDYTYNVITGDITIHVY